MLRTRRTRGPDTADFAQVEMLEAQRGGQAELNVHHGGTLPSIDTDAVLEKMTSSLLKVTSVFLIQQNELQEVRERLQKELARVSQIQDVLAHAAQQHQDAVLSAVQSYENLSVAYEAALARAHGGHRPTTTTTTTTTSGRASGGGTSTSGGDGHFHGGPDGGYGSGSGVGTGSRAAKSHNGDGSLIDISASTTGHKRSASAGHALPTAGREVGTRPASASKPPTRDGGVRSGIMPPVSSELHVFKQKAKPRQAKSGFDAEEEEEGIQYVSNLQVVGGVLGITMKASGDFVGTPTVQWSRLTQQRGALTYVDIPGATSLEYYPNADDVGRRLRVEATGPYGGDTVEVETSVVALDPNTHMALLDKLHKGHAEFSCVTSEGNEARVLLVTQKNVKVRSRHSSIMQSAQTLYKQGYDLPLTVNIGPHSDQGLVLRLGPHTFSLEFDSARMRDLAVLCLRLFAGPECPLHETDNGIEAVEASPAHEGSGVATAVQCGDSDYSHAASDLSSLYGASSQLRSEARPEGGDTGASSQGKKNESRESSEDEEEEREEEEFRPVMRVAMRTKEDAIKIADAQTLKSFSLSLAPPKSNAQSRGRGGGSDARESN